MSQSPQLPDASRLVLRAECVDGLQRAAEAIHALYRDADVQFDGLVVRAIVGGMQADLLWSLIVPTLRGYNVERVFDDQPQLQHPTSHA